MQIATRADRLVRVQPSFGRLSSLWRELRRNRGAVIGGSLLIGVTLLSAAAPAIAPYDPLAQAPAEAFAPPGPRHWFGTDNFGRDVFSRVLHGGQISLRVGLISVGIASSVGVVLGLLAGYRGNRTDGVIMRATDALMAFPGILLALVVVSILRPGLSSVMIAVGVAGIPTYARVVRGVVLAEREQLYIEAARVVGCPDRVIMLRHLLPSVVPALIVLATLGMGQAILTAASLSFIGMGARPPIPEWGSMLSAGRDYLRQAWWVATFPGLAIFTVALAINMLGDGLRDALDPRLRGQ